MSGLLSVGGLATGIDTKTLVSQLMALERQPETLLTKSKTKMQSQIDVYTPLQSALSSLQSLMSGMNTAATFQAQTPSVSDSAVATAQASSTAVAGSHDVVVTSLARVQRQVSNGYASSSDLNFRTGTIKITGGASDVSVIIGEGSNSLSGIAAAINSSGANLTASIINDGSSSPYRLVVTGKDTTNYTLDTSGLTDGSGTYANPFFPQTGATYSAASNAVFSVDGVDVTKNSNVVTDVIPGVTLTLLRGGGSTTTVTVKNDTSAVTDKINNFVSVYNEAIGLINKQSVYDTKTKTAGPLSGDSTLRSVKDALRGIISSPVSGVSGQYSLLSQIGITTDSKTGTLTVDSAKLSTALSSDFAAVTDLFTRNGGVPDLTDSRSYGIAERFKLQMDKFTKSYVGPGSSDNGTIATRIAGLRKNMTNIDDQVARMELLLTQKEDNLNKQFASMETLVSGLTTSGNAMINSLSNMPKWA